MDAYEAVEQHYAEMYGADTTSRVSIGDFFLSPTHPVNVKSNNVKKNNFAPNIMSASKLYDWLMKGNNLSFIFADYELVNGKVNILQDSGLVPIEHIKWDCLTIATQGLGVIQRCKPLMIDSSQTREEFIGGMRAAYKVYIDKQRVKLDKLEEKFCR